MITLEERITAKLPGQTSLFLSSPYNKELVEIVKTCDVKNFDKKTKEWEVPLSNLAYLLDRITKLDEVRLKWMQEEPEVIKKKPKLGKFITKPFEYQLEGIEFGLAHDKWLLLDAPGLGKSLQLIYLAQELKRTQHIDHCLIICGVNTLKYNWVNEIQKHSDLSCKILGQKITKSGKLKIGSIADRVEDLKNPIKEFFVITNIETLRDDNIIKQLNKNKVNKFDCIFVDEIHKCKSSSSTQGNHLLKLSAKYMVGATGTLLLNNPLDAYVPLKWIGVERSNQSTFKTFYENWVGEISKTFLGYRNVNILKKQLDKYGLRRTKDLLELPPKTIINELVDLNDKQEIFYNNIKEGIISQVDKVQLNAASVLSMVTRLRQATACPSILTSENISSSKVDRACDLVSEIIANEDKVVIFSTFKETVKILKDRLIEFNPVVCTGDDSDLTIANNIKQFQENINTKVMLATWQKMGTGITLTAASYAIFLDIPWTNAIYEQAQDRIYRIGSKNPVFIYNLVCKNTIDERVLSIVEDKQAISEYIIDDQISPRHIENLKKYIEELKDL